MDNLMCLMYTTQLVRNIGIYFYASDQLADNTVSWLLLYFTILIKRVMQQLCVRVQLVLCQSRLSILRKRRCRSRNYSAVCGGSRCGEIANVTLSFLYFIEFIRNIKVS